MNLKNKKILVTGSDGFIGSHLTEELVRKGCDVRAFVCYNSFNSWGWLDHSDLEVQQSLDVFAGDIRDVHSVRTAMKGMDIVIHLAALIAIPYSYQAPETYVETNINGTLNVLQAATDLGIEKVIHTSTSEVYGTAQYVPIDENHPLVGQSPYSATKIGADQMALAFFRSFKTPVAVIRPFNTYGPRQSARAVIPTIITQIATGSKSISLGALSPTRDFSYVKDTVAGFLAVAESDGAVGEVINVGSGFEISIAELVQLISRLMNRPVTLKEDEARLRPRGSEVDRLLASTDKARRILHWSPNFGGKEGLSVGLKETIEWFSDPNHLRHYKTQMYTK